MKFYELYVYDHQDNIWHLQRVFENRISAINKRNEYEKEGITTKLVVKYVYDSRH